MSGSLPAVGYGMKT